MGKFIEAVTSTFKPVGGREIKVDNLRSSPGTKEVSFDLPGGTTLLKGETGDLISRYYHPQHGQYRTIRNKVTVVSFQDLKITARLK